MSCYTVLGNGIRTVADGFSFCHQVHSNCITTAKCIFISAFLFHHVRVPQHLFPSVGHLFPSPWACCGLCTIPIILVPKQLFTLDIILYNIHIIWVRMSANRLYVDCYCHVTVCSFSFFFYSHFLFYFYLIVYVYEFLYK